MAKKKKDAKPCNICRGTCKSACAFCGWKYTEKKPNPTTLEQAAERGNRNRVLFLHELDCGSLKGGNSSVDDTVLVQKDGTTTEPSAAGAKIDGLIEKHRDFAWEIYKEVYLNCRRPDAVAKEHGLTKSIVLKMVHQTLRRLQSIDTDHHPRPPSPRLPEPEPTPIPVRVKEKFKFEADYGD